VPKKRKLASYLQTPDPNISLDVIMEGFPMEYRIRLDYLRSTLRRETLVFG